MYNKECVKIKMLGSLRGCTPEGAFGRNGDAPE